MNAFRPGGFGAAGTCHTGNNLVGYGNPQLILHEFGITHADQWPNTCYDGNSAVLDTAQKAFELSYIEDGLSDHVFRPSLDFVVKTPDFFVHIGKSGVRAHANHKTGPVADGVAAYVEAVVHVANNIYQSD